MSDIDKLHKLLLMIACEIDRICEVNGIEYSLDGGTLLGAVRHKGFIPWDDDFDIAMRRDQYERFLNACKSDLNNEKFFLQTDAVTEYAFAFSKIHLNGTNITEDFSKLAKIHHGIFIDIFPYDNLPDNLLVRKSFLFKNHLLKNLIWVKCNYGSKRQRRKASYIIIKLLGKIFTIEDLKEKRRVLIQKYNDRTTTFCFTSDYPKLVLRRMWFDNHKVYKFENNTFYGFEEADSFLQMEYGDYMTLPPANERRVHSNYKIDFGPYE